jgi:hypothetical protein
VSFMQSVVAWPIMLSIVMLNVIMLSVAAPIISAFSKPGMAFLIPVACTFVNTFVDSCCGIHSAIKLL